MNRAARPLLDYEQRGSAPTETLGRRAAPPAAGTGGARRRGAASPVARVAAALLVLAFAGWTALWSGRHLVRFDLRIVARVVPMRDHTHVLQVLHPLVHLGDAAFLLPVAALACALLYVRGYRRSWSVPFAAALTWPVELACKGLLPQPGTGYFGNTMTINDLIHDPITPSVGAWLQHAAPYPLSTIIGHAGDTTLSLASGYPSGTTARGVFALGLIAWLALRWGVPLLSEAVTLAALVPAATLGISVVLFAWHWPSDVVGGYLMGLALLALAIAVLRYPASPAPMAARRHEPPRPMAVRSPHSPHSRLPWHPND
jgi:membrane-associated phospholipid phosphatase